MTDTPFIPTEDAPPTADRQAAELAAWVVDAYDTLRKTRDLLTQIAPAAPLLDEIDELLERAESPYPTEVSVQPEAGADTAAPADPDASGLPPYEGTNEVARRQWEEHRTEVAEAAALVPDEQRDDLFDPATIVAPTNALSEFEPPNLDVDGELSGPTDAVQALALMLILCRLLLENNGEAASAAFVNEALSVVEDLWPLIPAEVKAAATAHANDWEEKAGW